MKPKKDHWIQEILLFVSVCLITGCSNDRLDRIGQLEKTMNNHQIRDFIALFAKDVSFQMGGYKASGIQELEKVAEWDSALNATFTFKDVRETEDTVFLKSDVNNDLMELMGFRGGGVADPVKIKFTNGLISYMSFSMKQEDMDKDKSIWRSFMPWAKENRQVQLQTLMPEGRFTINGTTAKGWLELFTEWRATWE